MRSQTEKYDDAPEVVVLSGLEHADWCREPAEFAIGTGLEHVDQSPSISDHDDLGAKYSHSPDNSQVSTPKPRRWKLIISCVIITIILIALVVGLSVGLTRSKEKMSQEYVSSLVSNIHQS
jgi:hypothetical protein